MSNLWYQLPKPIIGLSPMDGVTDQPYRHIQKKYGNPDLVYTEFTGVEGVCRGADRLLRDFLYDETQRPVIAQIYGTTPEHFRQTATILCQLGYDGIDINMGCPAKNVAHNGSGAALITTPKLAQDIIRATKAGVQDYLNGKTAADCSKITEDIAQKVAARHQKLRAEYQQPREIPVSVKTRVGFKEKVVDQWVPTLLEAEPAAIAIHGRTLKQQYGGLADWEEIAKGVKYTRQAGIPYLGNGDIKTLDQADEYIQQYGVDGVLIGRASFGNPYVFRRRIPDSAPSIYDIAVEHAFLYEQTYGKNDHYTFLPMRKHLGWYITEIPYAKDIRIALYKTNSAAEAEAVLQEHGLIG
jgi:nifR3 family TIM-barrel protein